MSETTLSPLPSPARIRAAGARRLTLDMRVRLDQADGFIGAPIGTAKPLTYLAAFQEAEPYLGLPAHAFKLVSWLVRQTRPQDWERGSRPIAWPSASTASIRHEQTMRPSTVTVQAPQSPELHPSLLPVRCSSSRSTSSRVSCGSHRNSVGSPLMMVDM